MPWLEQFEEVLKAPPIGSPEWMKCIPPVQLDTARILLANKIPVVVIHQTDSSNPSFLVLFDGTEFVAGGFYEFDEAKRFANSWNKMRH